MSQTVLIVCTGNVCRSPFIERLLAAAVGSVGVEVRSAGTHALVDNPMDSGSQSLLAARGADGSDFRARQVTADIVRASSLVLAATRQHRKEVVQLAPFALKRTVALLDFADLAPFLAPRPGAGIAGLLDQLPGARAKVTARECADVVDPFRQGPAVFDQMAAQVETALPRIIGALRGV